MKKAVFLFTLILLAQACSPSKSIFELGPRQSMAITGKGVGQDAALNPYGNEKSIALVNNLGPSTFSVRIQTNGEIIQEVEVRPNTSQEFILEIGYELYLDSETGGKAKVRFKRFD